ncbi:imm11 family protein [Corallococcus exercitus]|uniref:imm11 family protein n=1 Tax=Corallococcus exercitus TaxID=2316736 RepID=UPI0035D3DE79
MKIPVDHAGQSLDFTLAGIGLAPVIQAEAAAILTRLAPDDVQLLPVTVGSEPGPHFLVNVLRLVRCIDDEASEEVQYWKPEDGRPEKVGKYRDVSGLRIDPAKVGDARIFRTWGWTVALIVAEDIKEALEQANITGVTFREVTGPSEVSPEQREHNRKLQALYDRTETARTAFWRTLGTLDEKAILPIVVGGGWPAKRQVWRLIHRAEGRTLFVTDGLSDFFVEAAAPSVGFGLELALETDEPQARWPVTLLERIANELVGHEHLREPARTSLLSMEVDGEHMPEPLLTKDGRVAVLLGMDTPTLPTHFTMPDGQVRLVTVKTLMPRELTYLLEHGREELLHRFNQSHPGHLSKAWRQSVV